MGRSLSNSNLRSTRILSFFLCALIGVMGLLLPAAPGHTAMKATREYELKAAFLYNFGRYVEWPESAFSQNGSFSVCVFGQDPFGNDLNRVLSGQSLKGKPVQVSRIDDVDSARNCHILFISRSERGRMDEILGGLKGSNTLTVSETGGFTQQGGMINFVLVEGKVRFAINRTAAQRSGLKMSSQLLKLSTNSSD